MTRNPDDQLVKAGKLIDRSAKEPDLAAAPEHKLWVNTLGKADLPARLLRDQADLQAAFKKSGLEYSTKELSAVSPFAPIPRKHDVVLYTVKGKVVGYSVGTTPLNNTR